MWEPRALDYLIWFFLFLLSFSIIFIYSKFKKNKEDNLLTLGFFIKAGGGFTFALIYIFYYRYGDTFRYYSDAEKLVELLLKNPLDSISIFFSSANECGQFSSEVKFHMEGQPEGWFMVKLTSVFTLLAAKSYLGTTLLFSVVSFLGANKFYQLCNKINSNNKMNFIISFLVPSVLVWGTGILKDTFTLCSINYLMYYSYVLVIERKFKLLNVLIIFFHVYILISLKSYILISYLPTILILIYLNYIRNLDSSMLKIILVPIVVGIIFTIGYFMINTIAENSGKYDVENIENTTEGFNSWHKSLGGSYYDIGKYEFTFIGILSIAPVALNVTYFRPYPWEINSFFMLINSFESMVFFIVFLFSIIYFRFKLLKIVYDNTFVFALLIFCLIFALAVGISSYNFGALARHKMPVLSPFLLIILYLNTQKGKKI